VAAPPTFQELYDLGKAEAQSRDPDLTDFSTGSVNDAYVGAGATQADQAVRIAIEEWKQHYIATATGDRLTAHLVDYFDFGRKKTTAGRGTLTFTRGSSSGDVLIPAGTTVSGTVDGTAVEATTDSDVTLASGDTTVDATATALETGTAGNVAAGVLTSVDDVVAADPDLTVTNADRFVGGGPEETDAAYRARFRRYWASLRRGTIAALITGAEQVDGVRYVTVDEDFIDPDDGGYVAVYVGDPDGRGNAALATLVDAELDNWRAAGIEVQVTASERDEITQEVTVYYRKGTDTSTLKSQIKEVLIEYADTLAPNETHYQSAAEAAVHALGEHIVSVVQSDPTADYSPASPHMAVRVNEADLTVNLVEAS